MFLEQSFRGLPFPHFSILVRGEYIGVFLNGEEVNSSRGVENPLKMH
jgi:hypothetical protein